MKKVKCIYNHNLIGITIDKEYDVIEYTPNFNLQNTIIDIPVVKILNDNNIITTYLVTVDTTNGNFKDVFKDITKYRNEVIDEILL